MKILIVDDDTNSQNVLQQTFTSAAFDVAVAFDGLDALQKLEESLPDIIISDVLMPRMDGFALCRQCKNDSRYEQVPFLFLTATYLDARDEQLARSLGVVRYLAKPQLPEDLIRIVQEVLSEHAARASGAQGSAPLPEQTFHEMHAEAISRKLEQKIEELENVNRKLERDIEVRKQTERALRNSENRFRMLTILAPAGIYETDVQGNCSFVNRQWCDLSGSSPGEALGRWWAHSAYSDDRESIAATWPGEAAVGGQWGMDYRFMTSAGAFTWVQGRMVAIRDEAGKVIGYLGSGLDITERIKAEGSLQESENVLRALINANPEGVLLLAADGTVITCNDAIAARLGKQPEALVGSRLWDHLPPDVAAGRKKYLDDVFRTGKPAQGVDTRAGRIIEHHSNPVFDTAGNVVACAVISFDITDRVAAEKTLMQQAQMLDQIHEAVIATDLQAIITGWNRGAERMFLYTGAETLGRPVSFIYPEDQFDFLMQNVIAPLRAKGEHESEVRCRKKNGEEFYALLQLSLQRDEQGVVVGMIGSSRDITERKQLEKERETLIAELQQSLAKVKQLSGLLPICASCKKIRDDKGYWTQIEAYIIDHSEAEFTHGLCPECADKYYKKYNLKRE